MAHYEHVKTSLVAAVGFISVIVVFAITVFLMVVYYRVNAEFEEARYVSQPWLDRDTLLAHQQARLVEYRWVDTQKKVVAIPIDRAMELVVRDLSASQGSGRGKQSPVAPAPKLKS